jgi:hypothetical protein
MFVGGWGHVTHMMGDMRGLCRVLVQKPNIKRPLGISTRSLEDNIKIHLKEINWKGTDLSDLSRYRDNLRAALNRVMNLIFHKMRGIFLIAGELIRLASQKGLLHRAR